MVLSPREQRFLPENLPNMDMSISNSELTPLYRLPVTELNPLPSSFVTYFPTTGYPASLLPTQLQNGSGSQLGASNWAAYLAVQIPKNRLPAWCRVPTAPTPRARCSLRTIMKRVGIPCRPLERPLVSAAMGDVTEELDNDHPARRRKLDDKLVPGEISFLGRPLVPTELDVIVSQAKTDVISHISNHPSLNKFHDNGYSRPANCRGTKRNADGGIMPGGQGWKIYTEHKGSLSESWRELGLLPEKSDEEDQRDLRTYPAASGVPDLSIIDDDETELEVSQTYTIPQPALAAATSPAKRKARLDNYSRNTFGLGANLVKLNPGITPASILTSPIKSQTSPPRDVLAVSSAFSLNEKITLEPKLPQSPMNPPPNGPAKTFKPSSYSDSNAATEVGPSSPMTPEPVPSPTKRPAAPTPSQWARSPLATPKFDTPATRQDESPTKPLGIVDSTCPSTPKLDASPTTWELKPEMFDFGDVSDMQLSPRINWLQNGSSEAQEATRTKNVNKSRRRKSEPILNKHLKKLGVSRRQSEIPQNPPSLVEEGHGSATQASSGLRLLNTCSDVSELHETDISTPTNQQIPEKQSATDTPNAGSVGLITPFSKYFLERQPLSIVRPAGTRSDRNGVYSVDMRRNPDIFNSRAAVSPAVQQLAGLAEKDCDGYANVVVTQSSEKLVVRFKLPNKYAPLFPQSQGVDEPYLGSSPSKIPFPRNDIHLASTDQQAAEETPLDKTPTPSSHRNLVHTGLGMMDSAFTPGNIAGTTSPSKKCHFPVNPANYDVHDQTLVVGDFDQETNFNSTPLRSDASPFCRSSEIKTPARQRQDDDDAQPPSSGLISDLSIEPTFQTPTFVHIDFSPAVPEEFKAIPHKTTPSKVPSSSSSRSVSSESQVKTPSVSPDRDISSESQVKTSPGGTPLATSFTPVNKNSPRNNGIVSRAGSHSKASPTTSKENPQKVSEEPLVPEQPITDELPNKKAPEQNLDSPGREYMRNFIRNMKPKRLSTTETGSPIAHSPARVPLEAKSPNAGSDSPRKLKRKQGIEGDGESSPMKKSEEPAMKRIRRLGNLSKDKLEESRPKRREKPGVQKPIVERDAVSSPCRQDSSEVASEEPCRRSSRLNTQEKKSSIPTSIKLGRPTTGRDPCQGKLNSAVRNEQAELTRQTNLNTKKNKGKAESVQQILARFSEELSEGDTNDSANEGQGRKKAKNVTWRMPLESHQDEKPKRGRPTGALGKKKTTQGDAGVTKPKATPQKPRISKVAQSLGMAGNGTPAKRMTRARTRSQD